MPTNFLKYLLLLVPFSAIGEKPIDTAQIVNIGGIRQYIRIKGKDDSKPIILFLHGGPGGSLMGSSEKMTGKLQQHFIVVQWDQRETGETKKLNPSPLPLELEMFYKDTHELIDSLLKQFSQPKLYLSGYSWGSGMGFNIADHYPELLYAYIAISPVIDTWRSEGIALDMLRESMGKKAREELADVKIPYENWEQLYYQRKWLRKQEGQKFVNISFPKSLVQGWEGTWFKVWKRSCDINLFETLLSFNCPVYFFAGEKDFNTNATITREYFNKISAPKKDLYLFSNAGHALPETHPEGFQNIIIEKILPQTFSAGVGK